MAPSSQLPITKTFEGKYIRANADPLVGLPDRRYYRASGSKHAEYRFSTSAEGNHSLSVTGFNILTITRVLQTAQNGIIPKSWVAESSNFARTPWDEDDIFWRIIVAERDRDGNAPPIWYRRSWVESRRLSNNGTGDINTTELLGRVKSNIMTNFLRRVQAVIWNRRVAVLGDLLLGLVPEASRKGDMICILFGCDVPVVLRPLSSSAWSLIGEAYIYGEGIMNGDTLWRLHEVEKFILE